MLIQVQGKGLSCGYALDDTTSAVSRLLIGREIFSGYGADEARISLLRTVTQS